MNRPITIQAYKYGGRLHYEWPAEVIDQNEHYVMVLCRAGRALTHHTKRKAFKMPYPSIEIFFFNEWYTCAITFQTAERLMYYCNIAMPVELKDDTLSFLDLDLDVLKEPDEDWKVVDRDEFIAHQKELNYPADLIARAELALEQLQQQIAMDQFPFNGEIDYPLLQRFL